MQNNHSNHCVGRINYSYRKSHDPESRVLPIERRGNFRMPRAGLEPVRGVGTPLGPEPNYFFSKKLTVISIFFIKKANHYF